MDHESTRFTAFFVGWLALGVTMFLLFHVNRDADWKRRWWPWASYGTGVAFFVVTLALIGLDAFVLMAIPVVLFIAWSNVHRTKFCEACGRTIYNYMGFARPEYCTKCGARLPST